MFVAHWKPKIDKVDDSLLKARSRIWGWRHSQLLRSILSMLQWEHFFKKKLSTSLNVPTEKLKHKIVQQIQSLLCRTWFLARKLYNNNNGVIDENSSTKRSHHCRAIYLCKEIPISLSSEHESVQNCECRVAGKHCDRIYGKWMRCLKFQTSSFLRYVWSTTLYLVS